MKYLSILILLSFLFVGCIKEESKESGNAGGSTTYYIKFKVNGTLRNLNYGNMAKVTEAQGITNINLIGGAAAASTISKETINLGVHFINGTPRADTFTQNADPGAYMVDGIYTDANGSAYMAGHQASPALPLSITISKLDSAEAAGTFRGAFYKMDTATGQTGTEYITISEGEFRLPIQ